MKKWMKAFVAVIALVAMLTENTYSVYATMDGYTSPETADEQVIEVISEEAETASDVEESVADNTSDTTETVAEDENIETVDDTGSEDTGAVLASEDIENLSEEPEENTEEETEEISEEVEKSLTINGGKIVGEGYNNLRLAIDASELSNDFYYVLYIDSEAQAEYDGAILEDNQIKAISNKVTDIYLSNLENKPFEIYVLGENSDEIGAEYFVESVENGAVRMSVNMNGSNISDDEETVDDTEENKVITVSATFVDEFGDEIGEEYKNLELSFDEDGVLILDDIENPPFENFEVEPGSGKIIKYTYTEAKIDGTIISKLRKQEIESEDTEDAVYGYDFATSEDNWETLTEDTVVELVYSDGTKTRYEYEDNDVYVVATLQHANAIPDDAEFIVTPITKESNGYNYDAYMEALNENAEAILGEEGTIDDDNTLLYDIGFFVTDEEGNRVEVQPQEGYVSIKVSFKNNQLEEEIASGADEELSVVHLPLSDEVKEEYSTTEDATDISAADINVEVLSENVNAESEVVEFMASEFSPYAIVGKDGKLQPGTYRTFQDVLGAASAYGIVANEMKIVGHFESNFAVGSLSGGQNVQTCRNSGGGAGVTYIGSYTKGGGFFMDANGNGTPAVIFTTKTAVNNMDSSMKNGRSGVSIDTTSYTEQQIKDKVAKLVSDCQNNSEEIWNESSYPFWDYTNSNGNKIKGIAEKNNEGKWVIDLSTKGSGAGTYYITFNKGDYAKIPSDNMKIILNKDQNIIFNIPDETVSFKRYQVTINGISGMNNYFPQADAKEDELCQRVIFNCPNAKTTETAAGSPNAGVFVVPNSTFSNNEVAAGWVVADKIAKIGGQEWHCVYHDIPSYEPVEAQITATKTVDGNAPKSDETFEFVLESYDFGTTKYTEIQRKKNNGGTVTFDKITYAKEGVYAYRVSEVQAKNDKFSYDTVQYIVHHKVKRNGLKYEINETKIYIGSDYVGNDNSVIKFNNLKPLSYDFDIEKKFGELKFIGSGFADTNHLEFSQSGAEWPDGVTFDFILKPFFINGIGATAKADVPMPSGTEGNGANRYKKITLSKDNPTGSFGSITVTPNQGFSMNEKDTVHNRTKVNCQVLLYTIEEVIPDNKPTGVTYSSQPVRYIKLFVNTYKNSDGSYSVEIEDKESMNNNDCCKHVPGPFVFANKYTPSSLKVKKVVSDKSGNAVSTNDAFYVVVYSLDNNGHKTYYDTEGGTHDDVYVEEISAGGELNYTPIPNGITYYVFETDENGNIVESGRKFEYSVNYEGLGKGNDVTYSSTTSNKTVTVTNTPLERGTLTLVKKGGSGNDAVNLKGVTFVLKEDDGNNNNEGTRVYVEKIKDGEYKYVTEGSTLQDLVTDENGEITVSNLPIGSYYLKETALPDEYGVGYVKYEDSIKFKVNTNGTTTLESGENENVKKASGVGIELKLTVTNKRLPAAIIIKKSLVNAKGGAIDKNRTLDGFKFYLYDTTKGGKTLKGNVTTDGTGKASFAGMLEYGHSYVIEEDADSAAKKGTTLVNLIPSNFTIDESWYTNSKSEAIGNVTYVTKEEIVTNTPVTGKIRLIKQDAKGATITEGSAWFVLSTSNNFDNTGDYVKVSGTNGSYSYDSTTTNTKLETADGEIIVDKLAPGTYYFFETKSPDANKYTYTSGTPYSFTIDAKDGTASEPVIDLTGNDKAVKVKNDTFNAKLSFIKVNAFDTSKKLTSGTEFTLYEQSNLTDAVLSTSVANGTVTVPFAKAAKYVLVETKTENGYEDNYGGDKLKIYFEVTKDQAGKTNLTLADVNAYVTKDGRTLKAADFVDKTNNLVKNEPKTGKVTLVKKFLNSKSEESDKYVGEAKFKLFTNSVEYKTAMQESATVIKDAEKFIQFGDEFTTKDQTLVVDNLPWGSYYFLETATVSVSGKDVYNYDSNEKYSFVIGEGADGSLELDVSKFTGKTDNLVNNTIKTGSVTIKKQDFETEEGISGIIFELYTADNVKVEQEGNDGKYVTGNDGTLTVTDLEFGSYYFKESPDQTVTGYTFDTTTKYSFTITGEAKSVTELTYTVTENGSSVNKTSPKGIITNKPIKGNVTLEKWAITKGTAKNPDYISTLSGAEFKLYSNNPSTFGQEISSLFNGEEKYYVYKADGNGGVYTTDENGLLSVHDLPWGSYYFIEIEAPVGYTPVSEIPDEDRTFRFAITNDNLDIFIGREMAGKVNDELSGKVPVNERQYGSVWLVKKDDETDKGIPGVAFILKKDGVDYTGKLNSQNTSDLNGNVLITDGNGEIHVHDLPWGTYTFEEEIVPEGYRAVKTLSDSIIINETKVSGKTEYNGDNGVTMYNSPIKGELFLEKVNEYDSALTGATFDLVRVINKNTANAEYKKVNVKDNGNGNYEFVSLENKDYRDGVTIGEKIAQFVSNIFSGNAQPGSLATSSLGTLLVTNLPYGDYEIYEMTPPDGYEPNSDAIVRSFKIDGEKTGNYDASVKFVNAKVFAGVQFVKKAGNKELNGVKFVLEVFDQDAKSFVSYSGGEASAQNAKYYAADDSKNTLLGEFDGVVTYAGLPVGQYRVYEVSDSDYSGDGNTSPYLDANGNYIWKTPNAETKYYEFTITGSDSGKKNVGLDNCDGSDVFSGSSVQIVNNIEREGKAMLLKTDGTSQLSGAKFELHKGSKDDKGFELGKPSETAPLATIEANAGVVLTDSLPWGDYYLVEKETKDATFFLENNIDDRAQYHFTIGPDASGKFVDIITSFTVLKKSEKDAVAGITTAVNEKFYGEADFAKRDAETGALIKSDEVVFELWYKATQNGTYSKLERYSGSKALKASDGKIKTQKDLEAGWYYFIETNTAAGYEELPVDETKRVKYSFTITQGDTVNDFVINWGGDMKHNSDGYYVENTPKHGSIELLKFYRLEENSDITPLAGATFKLVGKSDKGDKIEKTETSDSYGKVLFSNLPWGKYDIKEVTPPAGYKLPENVVLPKDIVINDKKLDYSFDETATLKIENERKLGKLSLKKVDDKGNTVAGVKFELQKKEGNDWVKVSNPDTSDGYYVTGKGGLLSFFNLRDKKGTSAIENLEWGQYRLIECYVPEGYLMMEGYIPNADGVYVGAENMTDETHLEYDLGEIENSNVHGNIGLKKIDNAGNGLAGAKFKLYQSVGDNHQANPVYVVKSSDGVYAYVSMDAVKAAETDGYTDTLVSPAGTSGKIKVTGLPCGTYYMQETKEPDPGTDANGNTIIYQMNTALIGPFVVNVDQEAKDDEQILKTWENGSGEFKAEVVFKKTDADGAGLDGVKYTVTSANSSWTVESKEENGVHGVVRIYFTATGEYTIKEASTPNDAYTTDPSNYSITILASDDKQCIDLSDKITVPDDGTSKFNMSQNTFLNDEAPGKVKLVKSESESNGESAGIIGGLNGVDFKLYKVNNGSRTLVDSQTTSKINEENGVIYVSDLAWGEYVFVETVPSTHTAKTNEYPFTIDAKTFEKDQKIEVVKADNVRKPGSLKLQKFFENPEEDFNGENVAFTLTLVSGTSDVCTTFTQTRLTKMDENKDYFVEFTGLPWGIYTLTEGDPAEGYLPYTETKTIKIGNAIASEGYNDSENPIIAEGIDVELIGDDGITNNKIKGSVKFQKVDSVKSAPIGGVEFKLYKGTHPVSENVVVSGDPVIIPEFTDDDGVFKTDKNGYVAFPEKSLEYGNYYLAEAIPEGYENSTKSGDDLAFVYTGIYFEIDSEAMVDLTKVFGHAIINTPKTGTVTLRKVDNTSDNKPIKGVEFILYADDAQGATATDLIKTALVNFLKKISFSEGETGTIYRRAVTDENGEIKIDGLPWGTYHFVESEPTGYSLSDAEKGRLEKPFVIGENSGTVTLDYSVGTITNDRNRGYVELTKKGKDEVTGKSILLPGAEFSLYKINGVMDNQDGILAEGDVRDTLIKTGLVTSNIEGEGYGKVTYGKAEGEELEWGYYYFVEDFAPEGYDKSTDTPEILTVGILPEEGRNYTDVTVKPRDNFLSPSTEVTNVKGYGYTALYKVFDKFGKGDVNTSVEMTDENGTKTYLTFEIYEVDNDNNIIGSPYVVLGKDGSKTSEWIVNKDTMMTDIVGPLPYGNYAFVEKSVPSGVDYEKSSAIQTFVISDKSTEAAVKSEMENRPADGVFTRIVKFVNTTYRGWSSITKIDAATKEAVEEIDFDVYEVKANEDGTLSLGMLREIVSTKEGGIATVDELPLGKYAFLENAESARKKGYIASDAAYVFDVTETTAQNNARSDVFKADKVSEDCYKINSTDTVTSVENTRREGSIRLTKYGKNGSLLDGATFNLYKVIGEVDTVPGVASGTDTADKLISAEIETEDGTVTVTDFVTENGEILVEHLEWGTYYFDEIIPPQGYKLIEKKPNHSPVSISGKDVLKTAEVELSNETIKVDISKTDISGTTELEGAEFAIYEQGQEQPVISWISGKTSKRIEIGDGFMGLKASLDSENPVKYILKELAPPEKYTAVSDITFSVDAYGKVTLYGADANEVMLDKSNDVQRIVVKDANTEIYITKRELGTTRYLTGAVLKVFDEVNYKKYKNGDDTAVSVDEWETVKADNGLHTLSGKLMIYDDKTEESKAKSSYYLVETSVPAGYYKAADVAFHINNDNKIVIDGDSSESYGLLNDDRMLAMYDRPIYVSVNKKATTGSENLSGATLSVYDENKTVNVTFETTNKPALLVPATKDEADSSDSLGKYKELAETYQIVYGAKFIEGTEYTLHEADAPDGYKIAADQKFYIDTTKSVYNKTLGIYGLEMLDDIIKIYVSKYDMYATPDEDGNVEELPGAKFTIYELAEDGETRGKEVVSWISDLVPHLVSLDTKKEDEGNLIRGKKYVLVENTAPLGYACSIESKFTVKDDGTIETDEYVTVNEERIPKISVKDEPLALCVTKVNDESTKLEGAELELRDGTGADAKTIAKWTSDGKVAFISQFGTYEKEGFTTVKLTPGYKPVEGNTYYVYEVSAPAGYKKALDYTEVTFKKLSESTKDAAIVKVVDSRFGETSVEGKKTWKISDNLRTELLDQKKTVKIELYRYYEENGKRYYVDTNNEVVEQDKALVAYKELNPANDSVTYCFDKLAKYFYDENGKAHEFKFEVKENLNGLEDKIISKQDGNNFINYQKYTQLEGDKKWILLKDENRKVIDLKDDETLKDAIFSLKNTKSAYVDTNIILATIDKDGNVVTYDENGDGKADYYVTIKYGAKDPTDKDQVEVHDIIDVSGENKIEHIEIKWTQSGQVHFGFKNLPMYDTETGAEIKYAFIEKPVDSDEKSAYRVIYGENDQKLYGTDGVTITNEPIVDPFSVSGYKTWKDPFDNDVLKRPTVTIQLCRDGNPMSGTEYTKTLTAENNYFFEFKNLYEYDLDDTRDGHRYTYEVKEIGADADYSVTIDFNGKIQRLESDNVRNKTANITNTIKPEKISISGTKTWNNDYNKSVPEVTFKLYATDSTGTEKLAGTYVMKNSAGNTYKFTNLDKYDANGKVIKYRVEEDMTNLGGYVSTPENGYVINPNPVRGADITITGKDFVNTPSLVRVRKVEEDTSRSLSGAKLRVVDSDGKTVDSWTTTSSDHYIEGLTFGETYTLEETAAPSGYEKASSVKFTVDEDSVKGKDVLLVTMEDPKVIGKVSLTKRDSSTRETLSGATFNLYNQDGSLVHVTGSSGTYTYSDDSTKGTSLSVSSAGALTVDKLPYGAYYFKETGAPKGYKQSTDTQSFTIYEKGATVDVTFLNERSVGSAYLRKTATDGTTTLAGAEFELYSATPRTAGQAAASTLFSDAYYRYGTYTTGADGMIRVDNLPWDDYYFIEVKAPTGYVTNEDTNGDPLVYTFTIDSGSSTSIGVNVGTITNDTLGGGGDVVGTGVAGVRRNGGVLSDVLGVRAKPTSGVLGARIGPVTGDAANIALWLLILVASVSIIVVICIQNSKKKKTDKR